MPRTSRASGGGFVCHVLNLGNGHSDVFHNDDDFAALVNLMREAHQKGQKRLTGCCLMTNIATTKAAAIYGRGGSRHFQFSRTTKI